MECGAVASTAPASVSDGLKATRREISVTGVLSGIPTTALLALHSDSMKVATATATTMARMDIEMPKAEDRMYQLVLTPAHASRRGSKSLRKAWILNSNSKFQLG